MEWSEHIKAYYVIRSSLKQSCMKYNILLCIHAETYTPHKKGMPHNIKIRSE